MYNIEKILLQMPDSSKKRIKIFDQIGNELFSGLLSQLGNSVHNNYSKCDIISISDDEIRIVAHYTMKYEVLQCDSYGEYDEVILQVTNEDQHVTWLKVIAARKSRLVEINIGEGYLHNRAKVLTANPKVIDELISMLDEGKYDEYDACVRDIGWVEPCMNPILALGVVNAPRHSPFDITVYKDAYQRYLRYTLLHDQRKQSLKDLAYESNVINLGAKGIYGLINACNTASEIVHELTNSLSRFVEIVEFEDAAMEYWDNKVYPEADPKLAARLRKRLLGKKYLISDMIYLIKPILIEYGIRLTLPTIRYHLRRCKLDIRYAFK